MKECLTVDISAVEILESGGRAIVSDNRALEVVCLRGISECLLNE